MGERFLELDREAQHRTKPVCRRTTRRTLGSKNAEQPTNTEQEAGRGNEGCDIKRNNNYRATCRNGKRKRGRTGMRKANTRLASRV